MSIPQFESCDLNTVMAWYLTGKVTMQQLADALNTKLREKAEREQLTDPTQCPEHCPKCGSECAKLNAHARRGYEGICGYCWCSSCKAWYIAGETTLLRDRTRKDKVATSRVPECKICFDEEGSYGCVRPAHRAKSANADKPKSQRTHTPNAERDLTIFNEHAQSIGECDCFICKYVRWARSH